MLILFKLLRRSCNLIKIYFLFFFYKLFVNKLLAEGLIAPLERIHLTTINLLVVNLSKKHQCLRAIN